MGANSSKSHYKFRWGTNSFDPAVTTYFLLEVFTSSIIVEFIFLSREKNRLSFNQVENRFLVLVTHITDKNHTISPPRSKFK